MKVTIIGTGYVGLVTGACLAEMGNHVLCLDVDAKKIRTLESGALPIHEPGLLEVVQRNVAGGRLQFTTDVERAVAHGTLQFIAVGTPSDEDGSADLQYVLAAARSIGRLMTDYKVVVDKSTVPVGTGDKVQAAIAEQLTQRGLAMDFSVVSNPEFLKEGAAVADFMRPDRGGDRRRRGARHPADALAVCPLRAQPRPRAGDGLAQRRGHQVLRFSDDLHAKTFALWGLAYKPNTDDMREAPSRVIVAELTRRGAKVRAYDPVAAQEAARVMGDVAGLSIVDSAAAAVQGADALVIVTAWKDFRTPDFEAIKAALRTPVVFDGRNLYEPAVMAALGLEYHCVGRAAVTPLP